MFLFKSPSPNLSVSLIYWPISFSIFLQSKFTAISFNFLLFISIYLSSTYLYYFLFPVYLFVNPDWCLSLSIYLPIQIHGYIFQTSFLYLYFLYNHLYLFLSLVYPPLFLYISLSIQIDIYLFLSICQSKFTAISFKPVFVISIFCISTYIFFYLLSIHFHFFIYLSQSRLMPISSNPIFLISI